MLNPQRLLGSALALIGLGLLITGGWFAAHLGSDGTATFRATPSGTAPLVLEPSLLNRSDRTMTVTITPASGDTVWSALGSPSDANAAIAKTPAQRFTGVSLSGWSINHATAGTGKPAALATSDIWREQTRTPGPVTYTIDQAQAPEVLVATGTTSPLAAVEVTYTHRTWFFQALFTALVGLVFIGIGAFTVWSTVKRALVAAETNEQPELAEKPETGEKPEPEHSESDEQPESADEAQTGEKSQSAASPSNEESK